MRFLTPDMANRNGVDLVVADTANHLIRGINLAKQTVFTLAGTGEQWMQKDATSGPALSVKISTPWDVEIFEGSLLIAMAGEHRLWRYDFEKKTLEIFAGTTNEGLVDGNLEDAWFAQPSAIVASRVNPNKLWVIDAETSSLRQISSNRISSVIGKGLFDFGHVDGIADEALLQHPLGVIETPDGNLLIADTYNRAIRKYTVANNRVSTIARELGEPSDLEVIDTPDGPKLIVVETSKNQISILPIESDAMVQGAAMRTTRPALEVRAGEIDVEVIFSAPPGQKLDERYGPSTFLTISATPKELILSGTGNSVELSRSLTLNPEVSEGVLHVAAKGASCDESDEGAQCHIHQQDWGIPVRITPSGGTRVSLVLSGKAG